MPMTNRELNNISARIDEINAAVELCIEGHDDDVLDNLDAELESLLGQLEGSKAKAERRERGPKLTLIKGGA